MSWWRDRYDPPAKEGIAAHISLMVPFMPARLITEEVVADLRAFFAGQVLSPLEFSGVCAFPTAAYLPIDPEGAVREIIANLAERFPDTPPYGGTIPLDKIIPHVTVAYSLNPEELPSISHAFCRATAGRLPVRAEVHEAVLIVRDEAGVPRRRAVLPLAV